MIRLAWHQFRTEASIAMASLVVIGVVLAVTGPHLVHVYDTAPNELLTTDGTLQVSLFALLLVTPALVGIFFGAPLIARELEAGTFHLAWTQGITRARWLVVKLALVGLGSSLLAGGLSLMAAWWANPIDIMNKNRFSPANFGLFGIVPFGYALFAVTLGATTGVIFRKTLPAVATTLVGYVGARLAVTYWIRPHFAAPVHKSLALSVGINQAPSFGFNLSSTGLSVMVQPPAVPNGWPLSAEVVDNAGHTPTSAFLMRACPDLAGSAQRVAPLGGGRRVSAVPQGNMQSCIATIAAKFHEVATYQPASRYWSFQIYETALFVILALALAGISFWWVRRRLT